MNKRMILETITRNGVIYVNQSGRRVNKSWVRQEIEAGRLVPQSPGLLPGEVQSYVPSDDEA